MIASSLTLTRSFTLSTLLSAVKGLSSSSDFWNVHVKNTKKYHQATRDPAKKEKYEQAFHAAKEEERTSVHSSPMDKLKASIKLNPFAKDPGTAVSKPTVETA